MTTNNPNEKICLGIVTETYSNAWFGTYTIGEANTSMVTDVIATVDMYTDPRVLPISTGDNPRTVLNNYYYGGVGGLGQPGIGIQVSLRLLYALIRLASLDQKMVDQQRPMNFILLLILKDLLVRTKVDIIILMVDLLL